MTFKGCHWVRTGVHDPGCPGHKALERLMAAGKDPGLGSGELEEYPDILPGEEPHPYPNIDGMLRDWIAFCESRNAERRLTLGGRRNINEYSAKKTRRRRALEHLFDPLLRRVRRG